MAFHLLVQGVLLGVELLRLPVQALALGIVGAHILHRQRALPLGEATLAFGQGLHRALGFAHLRRLPEVRVHAFHALAEGFHLVLVRLHPRLQRLHLRLVRFGGVPGLVGAGQHAGVAQHKGLAVAAEPEEVAVDAALRFPDVTHVVDVAGHREAVAVVADQRVAVVAAIAVDRELAARLRWRRRQRGLDRQCAGRGRRHRRNRWTRRRGRCRWRDFRRGGMRGRRRRAELGIGLEGDAEGDDADRGQQQGAADDAVFGTEQLPDA